MRDSQRLCVFASNFAPDLINSSIMAMWPASRPACHQGKGQRKRVLVSSQLQLSDPKSAQQFNSEALYKVTSSNTAPSRAAR